jgi:hypothetical protein
MVFCVLLPEQTSTPDNDVQTAICMDRFNETIPMSWFQLGDHEINVPLASLQVANSIEMDPAGCPGSSCTGTNEKSKAVSVSFSGP